MGNINALSLSSFYTEIFFNNEKLSSATSFAYKYKNQRFLITNYHVAFGRNPENNKILNEMCSIPNKLVIYYYNQKLTLNRYYINFNEDNNPFKFVKQNGKIADIAVYKLDESFQGICINEIYEVFKNPFFEQNTSLNITDCLYVLGYPRGINVQYTPIWKKSTVASEPECQIEDMDYFYIDTTTREGMSGSPVIFYSYNGSYSLKNGSHMLSSKNVYNFIGIYSGRDRNDEPMIAQLGKVWKAELIEQVIENNYDFSNN